MQARRGKLRGLPAVTQHGSIWMRCRVPSRAIAPAQAPPSSPLAAAASSLMGDGVWWCFVLVGFCVFWLVFGCLFVFYCTGSVCICPFATLPAPFPVAPLCPLSISRRCPAGPHRFGIRARCPPRCEDGGLSKTRLWGSPEGERHGLAACHRLLAASPWQEGIAKRPRRDSKKGTERIGAR